MKTIYKLNDLSENESLQAGQKLKIRKMGSFGAMMTGR